MSDAPERRDRPAPSAAGLAALASDDWAWLLGPIRRALHDLDDADVTPRVARLRAAPAGRLAGGRLRGELVTLLASGGPAWRALAQRLDDLDAPATVVAAFDGTAGEGTEAEVAGTATPTPPQRADGGAQERARLRERLRRTRAERDQLRRKLEGAEARAARDAEQLQVAWEEAVAARADAAAAREQLAAADAERERAVAREQRRGAAALARLEEELSTSRRDADLRDREADRRVREARAAVAARRAPADSPGPAPSATFVPGRPSELPVDVHPDTREAVELLLHPGRLVLVDGYNLTKQHHPQLDLERQRAWLVQLLAVTVARRRVRATAVFDGAGAGSRPAPGVRDVTVRFTPDGVTADDELVLAVESTDEPVVVVTDDRELTGRLRASGADVVGTRPFLWATR